MQRHLDDGCGSPYCGSDPVGALLVDELIDTQCTFCLAIFNWDAIRDDEGETP